MLNVSKFGRVQFDVVLGQNLHDGPDLHPPLALRDTVPAAWIAWISNSLIQSIHFASCMGNTIILTVCKTVYNICKMCMTYSKSVSSFSSERGWKVSALFLMPSTQAESGVLAKIRPNRCKGETVQLKLYYEFL